jgi:chloramphenicol 3-O-phosphotransferase
MPHHTTSVRHRNCVEVLPCVPNQLVGIHAPVRFVQRRETRAVRLKSLRTGALMRGAAEAVCRFS